MNKTETSPTVVNGLDLQALGGFVEQVQQDPANGMVAIRVKTEWKGGTRSESRPQPMKIGAETVERPFVLPADEPFEIAGSNTAPNPQELLMAGMNACILVGYVAGAAMNGITLERAEIECSGELDLRGFFALDETVKPGYDSIRYTVRLKGNGTAEQFQAIHEAVKRTSPNYFNIAMPVRLDGSLVVE